MYLTLYLYFHGFNKKKVSKKSSNWAQEIVLKNASWLSHSRYEENASLSMSATCIVRGNTWNDSFLSFLLTAISLDASWSDNLQITSKKNPSWMSVSHWMCDYQHLGGDDECKNRFLNLLYSSSAREVFKRYQEAIFNRWQILKTISSYALQFSVDFFHFFAQI